MPATSFASAWKRVSDAARASRLVQSATLAGLALLLIAVVAWWPAGSQQAVQITAAISLTGPGDYYGLPVRDGVRLAVDEANADGANIKLEIVDDASSEKRGVQIAEEICNTPTVATVGPALTTVALEVGAVYASCGLAAIPPTAHGDGVPQPATMFQPVFNGGDMGSSLAVYLKHVIGGRRAAVLYRDNGYGRPFAIGFEKAAGLLGLDVTLLPFTSDASRQEAVADVLAAEPAYDGIALGMLNADAVPILIALRRAGLQTTVLAPSALGGEDFVGQFANEPEEIKRKGFFTEHVYAASPIMFDSAGGETLAFADRFRRRYGKEPSWPAVQGYDSARLAIAAALQARSQEGLPAKRQAALGYLRSLQGPVQAQLGVTGALWFTPERRRDQPVRIGLFHDGLFDSAPIQLVPVANPGVEELRSGEVFSALPGRYVRRQRVVYTGIFINEVPRIDVARATFGINLYLWMRFASDAGPNSFDPTDIAFPAMVGSNFARQAPSEQHVTAEGYLYRLWRVEGEVRNDFNLRRFPFDEQVLRLAFVNARASADRIVYVIDRGSIVGNAPGPGSERKSLVSIASPDAFRDLTQWRLKEVNERRENLVTDSRLGDPRRVGADRFRELSGFVVDTVVERRSGATAGKTLLPLLLMTIIMFASLYFPHGLVKEKVTVAITAALSGAVLLASVNSQLGNVGYVMAVEYAFYVFFGLSVLCILSVLAAERLRVAGNAPLALRSEGWTRTLFMSAVLMVLIGSIYV